MLVLQRALMSEVDAKGYKATTIHERCKRFTFYGLAGFLALVASQVILLQPRLRIRCTRCAARALLDTMR